MEFSDIPKDGNAAHGAELFSQTVEGAPPCSACHALTDVDIQGPGLANYGDEAGDRVDGESAEEYTFNSIVNPSKHIVTGYSNVMYKQYADAFSTQDIADLIAYLLQQ